MNKKTIKTIAMVVFATLAGYGGVKAYGYSYGKSVNSKDNLLMQNIEALSRGEDVPEIPCDGIGFVCSYKAVTADGDTITQDTFGKKNTSK